LVVSENDPETKARLIYILCIIDMIMVHKDTVTNIKMAKELRGKNLEN